MGMVFQKVKVRGDKGSLDVNALFDTGASKSLIRRDVAKRIGTLLRSGKPWIFQLGDGKGRLQTREMMGIYFLLKGVPIVQTFIVSPSLSEEMIIGMDLMQFWKIRPDPVKEDILIDKRLIQLKLV